MANLRIPDIIPIFPLPETVLLPSEVLPLHIFEPRYRQMVRDALESSRVIGMTMLMPGYERDYLGSPEVNPTGCAGVIAQHQALPDGRILIVLVGVQKFVIHEELPRPTLYRQVRVQHCPELTSNIERASLQSMRSTLMDRLPGLYERIRGERIDRADLSKLDDNQLIAVGTQMLQLSSREKQNVLEAESLIERYVLLHEALEMAALALAGAARRPDPSEVN